MMKHGLIAACFTVTILLYTLYSFTQVDLNLTLSSFPVYQEIQQKLLWLGYYNRPASSVIFVSLVVMMFLNYVFMQKSNFFSGRNKRFFVFLVLAAAFAGLISYPAFSHDFFNYMFDARIVTLYHQNPYYFRALDFPGDLWVRFMHWTHRTYPYGPVWLLLTLPFSFLGFGKFVLTLFLFKAMFVSFYLLNVYLVYRIASLSGRKNPLDAAALFAFNPLIITETLVSPHNESALLTFLLLSLYFLFRGRRGFISGLCFLVAALVKYVSAVLLPLYFFPGLRRKSGHFFVILAVLLLLPLTLEINLREAYPWYFVPLLGMMVLSGNAIFSGLVTVLSFGALLRYTFYLQSGTYSPDQYLLMDWLLLLPISFWLIYYLLKISVFRLRQHR